MCVIMPLRLLHCSADDLPRGLGLQLGIGSAFLYWPVQLYVGVLTTKTRAIPSRIHMKHGVLRICNLHTGLLQKPEQFHPAFTPRATAM